MKKLLFISLFLVESLLAFTQVVDQLHPFTRTITGEVAGGYLFITPASMDTADLYPSSLSMLDSVGNPVFFKPWTSLTAPPYPPVLLSDFKVQPSGMLSYATTLPGGGMKIYLLNNDFELADSVECVGDVETDGHDFTHTPDGYYHLVGTEERVMDLSGLTTASGAPGSSNATVVGNVIQRLDEEKNLVFEWKSLDHFALEDVYSHFFIVPNYLDHSHYNSLFLDDDGHYLISFRHLHEITKINAITGEVIWRLGGKQNQFSLLGDTMLFSAQHDARRTAEGTLTLFDNGAFNSTPGARALEYELDEQNLTATDTWQFQEPNGLSSLFIGSTQRLPNGNTLIDWGGAFPLAVSTTFTEVDENNNVALSLDFDPPMFISYRGLKMQLPFPFSRPEISCDQGTITLSAPPGHAYYEWNTGQNTQTITVSDTGTYQVWVNQGIGYLSSLPFYINDINNLCGVLSEKEISESRFTVYPNPAKSSVYISASDGVYDGILTIRNHLGQPLKIQRLTTGRVDISTLEPGLYFLEVTRGDNTSQQKLIVRP